VLLTFFFHSDSETLLQSTEATLVAFVLVDTAAALEATRVRMFLANRSPKETFAAVARLGSIVLSSGAVAADGTLRGRSAVVAESDVGHLLRCGDAGARRVLVVQKPVRRWVMAARRCDDRRHLGEVV